MKRFLIVSALLTILLCTVTGCQTYAPDYKAEVLEYAMICEDGDLSVLNEYPNLQYVDLRGSLCYDEIVAYAEANPDVTVRYNVQLGERRFNQDITEIELNCYETDYEILIQNLKYLKDLKNLRIHQVTFTAEQLNGLKAAYPQLDISYNVELCGRRFDHDIKEVDLSHMTPDDVADAADAIGLLPNLETVILSDTYGQSNLEIADVEYLMNAFPNIGFRYVFSLYGKAVSTLDEEIVFDSVNIGNKGLEELRSALEIMPRCTYIKLDSCGIDNTNMEQLRSEYPDIKIVWRVFAGRYSILTDEIMLRMPNSLTDKEAANLKYCTEIRFLDVNYSKITNIDFVKYMPELECAVLTMCPIEDLEPLTGCSKLTWLELCGCSLVEDLSPLSDLSGLKYLNVAATTVKDLSPLDNLKLERFNCVKSSVKSKELNAFIDKHPDCLTVSKGSTLGYGWRYDDKNQRSIFPYYEKMIEIFRYDDKTFTGNRKS